MKISISKQELFNQLKTSVNLLDSLNSNPIMDCLLIEVDEKQLTITSSNVFSSLKNTTPNLTVSKTGKVLVKGKILYNIISKIKEKLINLEVVDNSILRVSTTSFLCDINILDHFSYPNIKFDIQNWTKFTISSPFINKIINKVSSCINPLEQNQILAGVLIDSTRQDNTIEATGTDGFHLIYIKEKYNGEKVKIILNNETIKQLNFLINQNIDIQNIFFFLQHNQLTIQINNSLLLCRLLEGTYPSAIKTIEGRNELFFSTNKSDIINAIERGMIVALGDKKPSITLNIQPNKLKLTCRSVECGASYEELNIESNIKEAVTVSLNAKLLLDLIKNIDTNKVIFEFTSNNKPIIIKNENDANYISLILPIRNI